jgi:AcrR family transcriptional regulator
MPKIIEDIESRIRETAKRQLLSGGYQKLTLRGVATECGIAVGTIYNYFPSKELLIATVMLEDWKSTMATMKTGCKTAGNVTEGFRVIYQCSLDFSEIYRQVWSESSSQNNAQLYHPTRHLELQSQLAGVIRSLLTRFEIITEEAMDRFLAESVLTVALQENLDFEILALVLSRLFG